MAGIPCRYNGFHKNNKYINKLIKEGKAVPLCPEQLAGLPIPREICECKIVNGDLKVISNTGKNFTADYIRGSEIVLEIAKQ